MYLVFGERIRALTSLATNNMDETQRQLNELKKQLEEMKRSSTFPYEIQKALEERLKTVYYATATLDFGSTLPQTSTDKTISLPQAVLGDLVVLGVPNAAANTAGAFSAWVSADGTVTVRFINHTAGALDPASGDFKVAVIKTQI